MLPENHLIPAFPTHNQFLYRCNQLEPFFPSVREIRRSDLVSRTLEGCKRLKSKPMQRNHHSDVIICILPYRGSVHPCLTTTFFGQRCSFAVSCALERCVARILKRGGILVNTVAASRLQSPTMSTLSYYSLTRQTDFSKGMELLLLIPWLYRCFELRDNCFPLNPFLWVKSDGEVPRRSFFMSLTPR